MTDRGGMLVLMLVLAVLGASAQAPAPKEPVLPARAKIHTIVVEHFWQVNTYILVGPNKQAIIIDPGDDYEWEAQELYRANGKDVQRIWDFLQKNKIKLKYMLITHGHIDHLGGIKFLKEKTGATLLMHKADVRPEGDPLAGQPKDAVLIKGGLVKVDGTIDEGDIITCDGMSLKVLFTPGHSRGAICFLTKQNGVPILFSGDTLLHYYTGWDGNYYDTGRTNFRDGSGDEALLYKNVREKLLTLPENTIVYPGHYEPTTVGLERKYSPAMKVPDAPSAADGAGQ